VKGRIRLPSSQRDAGAFSTFVTFGVALPDSVRPPTAAAIIEELRQTLAVDLDQNLMVDRWPTIAAAATDEVQKSFLLVGSSHAGKLGAALSRMSHLVDYVYEPHCKVFKNSTAIMAEKVATKLAEVRVDCVVFCVLDNSMYHAVMDTGDILPPVRDIDGGYHIHGELMLSSKSAQIILLKDLKPLY
jgi:hypothetical protein